MGDWRDFPLPDGSYSDATRPWSQQDVVNYIPTFAEGEGTRSRLKLATAPGLEAFATVGSGPHRGARDVEGALFVVSGRKLYEVSGDGGSTLIGTIPGTGRVSMTHNQIAGGNELLIGTVDNSYVWNTVTSTLTATGVPLQSVDFLNQMFLGIEPQRRFWRYSALADGLTWNTLDNESAESSPDRIVGGIVSQGEWLVFGERTIEVWRNDPTEGTSFQRGPVIERGCANANTLCRLDNSVFFVDNNGIPCRLEGYSPVPIAPKAIIEEIGRGDPTKLFAFTYEDNGYVIYYLTGQDGKTWGYDVTTRRWHRRESFGMDRWRINTLFKWRGEWYSGDAIDGSMYRLRWGYPYEGVQVFPRRTRFGVLHDAGNRVFVHALRLLVDTGQSGAVDPTPFPPPLQVTWVITFTEDIDQGTVKTSVGGLDWSATGVKPSFGSGVWAPNTVRMARAGGDILAVAPATSGAVAGILSQDGAASWLEVSMASALNAAGGRLARTPHYWFVANPGSNGPSDRPQRSAGGQSFEAMPGLVNGTSVDFNVDCLAANARCILGTRMFGDGWVFRANLDGSQPERLSDLPDLNMQYMHGIGTDGNLFVVAGRDLADCHILSSGDDGESWTQHTSPFPSNGGSVIANCIVRWSEALELWFVTFFNRIAVGRSISNLTLSPREFPSAITDLDDDGQKIIVCGKNGMLEVSYDGIEWEALDPGVVADILGVKAIQ